MSSRSKRNPGSEFPELNSEVRRVWDANAEWWDDRIGDGNAFQCELIEPATERLLQVSPGQVILDVACGAGRFARRMAELGAYVVAFDFSERFIARAKQRTPPDMKNIEYHVADALEEEQVLALGVNRFDAAVATMALMDMASIDPLMRSLTKSLKPGGRFLFSVMHPCFRPPESRKFAEQYEGEERVRIICGIKVTKYLTPTAWKAEGIFGQPELQYYFHRPLSELLRSCFNVGFVIDGVEEPAFRTRGDAREVLTWRDSPEIPPVLVVRMRLLRRCKTKNEDKHGDTETRRGKREEEKAGKPESRKACK